MNQNIVFLTGAGISAESGIPTFRSGDNSIWNKDTIKFSTAQSLRTNRVETINFYNKLKKDYYEKNYQPNAAHLAIAKLQREYTKGNVVIITQNIDNLHEQAGSDGIIKMHGCLFGKRRTDTGQVLPWGSESLNPDLERPDIVKFGEDIMCQNDIDLALKTAKVFISVGTSLSVYPASDYMNVAKRNNGAETIFMNVEKTGGDFFFDRRIYGKSTETVPVLVEELLRR